MYRILISFRHIWTRETSVTREKLEGSGTEEDNLLDIHLKSNEDISNTMYENYELRT